MKPCSGNRKLIAWLALDALDAGPARQLRVHLEDCPGCRRYLDEITAVRGNLARPGIVPDLEASLAFRRRWTDAICSEQRSSVWETLAALLQNNILNWRVALLALSVTALAILAWPFFMEQSDSPGTRQPAAQAATPRMFKTDLPPTLASYQLAASQSLEAFDDLLTRQGTRNLPPVPPIRASDLLPASVFD